VYPSEGEHIGNKYYFKIIAEASAGSNFKNGYRFDASFNNGSTPTGISSGEVFAYSWCVVFRSDIDDIWDFHPFVPEGAGGAGNYIIVGAWDFDPFGGEPTVTIYDKEPEGAGVSLTIDADSNDTDNASISIGSDEDNGTWRVRVSEVGSVGYPNTSELWAWENSSTVTDGEAGVTDGTEPNESTDTMYRVYASSYNPPDPDHIATSAEDGTAIDNGTDTEKITFQVVDIDGNPLPYQQNIYVDVSTITNLTIEEKNNNADVDNPSTVGGTSTVVTTDVSGVGWITISRADTLDGTVTITPVTDGTNGSSDLPGTNESVDVVFDGRVPPTISSANYLLEDVGTAPVALPDITVTEGDTGNITVADDIRIRIPDSLDAVFNTGATVTTSVSGGTQGDTANGATYESGDKVAVIDVINNGFDSGRAVTISGLEFVSANSVSSGRLELSFNGGGLYPVDDDKLYTFDDLSSKKWYGTTDSDWNNAANWDPAAVPVAGDSVLIKNVTTQPVLTANTANALADLTIESGASLSLAGFTLYTSAFENQGTLIVNSGEDVSNFTLDTDSGAVEYSGGGTTIAAWTGYHDLRFSAGSWTLGSAVTVGDDLTIDAGDTLSSGNFDITVSGDWNNQGTYSSGTETVSFTDSAKSSTITGSTSFANLLVPSAAAGKTIYFQDGTTQIVTSDLSITGTSGNEILLRSTAPGTQWTIRNDTATQDISYVDVQDSNVDDASTGGDLLAAFSTDSGGNDTTPSPAWNFNPILTWTGAAAPDSDWNNAANWNPSVVPGTSSTVIIPDVANDPVLSTAVDVAELTIEDFGILDLAGSDLTVSGTFTMQPDARLILQGTEVVSGAGSLGTPIPGTVEYTGTTSSLPLGYSYTNLEKSTGGTLTLDSPLTLSGTLTVSGGTLDMNDGTGPYTATVAGDVVFSGGALSDPGEIIFDGGVVQTLTPDNQTFAALTVADTSGSTLRLTGTLTLSSLTVGSTETAVLYGAGGNVDVTVTTGVTNNGSFTMNDNAGANTLTMDAGGGSFTFTGNDIAYGGADLTIGGVDYLTNTAVPAGSVVTLNAGSTFDAVSIQGAAAQFDTAGNTLTAGGAITVGDGTNGGTLTVGSGGSISAAGQNLTVNADGTLASSGTITVTGFDSSGSVTNPAANSISAGGNVTIGGSFGTPANNSLTMTGAGTTLDAAVQIGSLTINPGAGNTVATLNNLSLNGSLDIQTGTFDTAANGPHNITLTGSWSNSGAYTSGANTVEFQPAAVETLTSGGTGDGQDFNNLTVNGGGTLQLDTNDLDVDGTLEITAGSTFNATATGRTLYVALGWTNSGTFSAGDSTVIFDTAAITAVNGDTIFATLEVSTAGKRVEFAAGSTQTADTVTFTGADGSLIELVSGTLGSTWNLTYNGTSATVEYVFIRDSDLLSTDITPVNSSNGGGNDPDATNIWNFPPVVWQGDDATTPSDWDTGANWNTGTVPSQWDDVRIPDVSPDPFPILGSNTTVADLDIAAAAASVSAAGFDLAVNGLFSNSGTLRLQGDEANVTGLGSPVPGLVEYYGTGTATVHTGLPAGSWYTNLRFDDPGGTPDIWQLGAPLDVDGYLTIAGGTLDASAGPHNVEIEGDWTNGGTYTAGGNTTVFNGAAAQALISGAASFSAVSVSGGTALSANAGVAFAAGGAVDIDGTSSFSISAAGADVGGNLTVSGAVSQGAGDELTVGGDLDLSGGGTFTSDGAQLLRFSGTTAAAVSPNNQNLGAVQVSTSGTKTVRFTGTATLTDLVIDASTTVTVGDTAAAAATLTVTNGTGDDVTVNGTLEFDAAAGAVSMRLADAAVLQNNGTVRVAADTNGVTLEGAAGGQMIYRGTDIDYDGQGITLGRIDYQTAMQLAAWESVTLSDALTADALTVADGASFDLDDQSLTVDNGALTVNGAFADTAASGTAAVSVTANNTGNVSAGGTATWAATIGLTMSGSTTDINVDPLVYIGSFTVDSGVGNTVAVTGNNLHLDGDLTIASGVLDSTDSGTPRNITLTGSWSNGGSYISGANTVTFEGGTAETLDSGGTLAGQHRFENIVINKPGGGLSLTGNDLYLEGNLQVTDGTFDASGFDITFAGTIWDVQSSTTATALFTQTNPGRVTFVNGGTIEIYGNNTFYEFWYEQAGGTILFEAEGGNTIVQTITGDFHVVSPGAQITLDSTAPVGAGPPYPADYETAPVNPEQWQINIDQPGGATATITEVLVYRSYALYPITPDPSCTDGTGNYDWLFFIPIEYSWSEDSDGDGRLDRIRVRVDTSVTLSVTNPTNFTGVDAEVEGYSLHPTTPFSVGSQDYEFFINLAENNELDTDVTPRWRLTANDPDGNVGLIGVVGGAMVEFGGIAPYNDPVDRAAPAIAYTLAVAGKNEIFVHLSEYAQVHLGGAISAADFDYNGGTTSITGLTRISTDGGNGTREFLLQLSNDVSATEVFEGHTLAGNGTIELITHLDDMVDVVWPGDAGPAPGVAPDAADELLAPATDIAPASDLGLGLTGSAVIQPVYAFTDSSTIERDTSRGGIGTIDRIDYGDFDASGWLQARNFTLEAALDTTLSTVNTEDVDLVWDLSVSAPYLYNNLWLPQYDPPGSRDYLCGLVSEVNTGTVSIADTTDGDRFRTYTLDTATYPEIVDNTEFEFFFRDSNGLFYARVANSSASNWYRTVRPWEFKIRNVRRQTARVSILDNVINPHRGDKVELHYILGDSGRYLIQVFNLAGDLVDVLYKGTRAPGEYTTAWDGRNRAGDIVARGIYFVRFIGPDIDEMRKVLVVR
jgi:autotransporter-associated beta strand protein